MQIRDAAVRVLTGIALAILAYVTLSGMTLRHLGNPPRVLSIGCAVPLFPIPWAYGGFGKFDVVCGYEPAFGSWSECLLSSLTEYYGFEDPKAVDEAAESMTALCSAVFKEKYQISPEQIMNSRDNASAYFEDGVWQMNVPGDDAAGVSVMKSDRSEYAVSGSPRHALVDSREDPTMDSIAHPVRLNMEQRRKLDRAYFAFFGNFDKSDVYGLILCWYIVGVLAVIGLCRTAPMKRVLLENRICKWIRGRFVLRTFGKTHTQHTRLSALVPTAAEAGILGGFFLLNIVMLCVDYDYDGASLVIKSRLLQWLRYIGDRSGIMSFAHLPLLILFCSRSMWLESLTGLRYTAFISLHKWLSRSMVLLAVIHSVAFKVMEEMAGTIQSHNQKFFWKIGVAGTYVSIVMVILSVGAIRRYWYETFYVLHVGLAVPFVLFMYWHIENLGWLSWVYITAGFWVCERVFRILSIAKNGRLDAELCLVGQDIFRVSVAKKANVPSFSRPGQFAFVYFLHPAIFWQSHPLTLLETPGKIDIIVKAQKGATRVLYNELLERKIMNLKVMLEGPYGYTDQLSTFDQILFIAGGSGVPGAVAHALESGHPPSKMHIVLVVRDAALFDAYSEEFQIMQANNIHLDVYFTGDPADLRARPLPIDSSVISYGRPDLHFIVNETARSHASAAVSCCGPPPLVDSVRNIAAHAATISCVEYIEEFQVW